MRLNPNTLVWYNEYTGNPVITARDTVMTEEYKRKLDDKLWLIANK